MNNNIQSKKDDKEKKDLLPKHPLEDTVFKNIKAKDAFRYYMYQEASTRTLVS